MHHASKKLSVSLFWVLGFYLDFFFRGFCCFILAGGRVRGPWGCGGFVFAFCEGICMHLLAEEGWPCPEAEASWESFDDPLMHGFPSHAPNSRVWWIKHHSVPRPGTQGIAAFIHWGRSMAGSCPWPSSPFLPKSCLVDSLLLTHTLSSNSKGRLQSLVHHPRTLHGAEKGVWKEW